MAGNKTRYTALRAYSKLHGFFRRGAITQGPMVSKVGLTFDDGPDRRWTPEICSILEKYDCRASFFMLGAQMEKAPELAREVVALGHEPCLHLFSHDRTVARDDRLFATELGSTMELIQHQTETKPRFLRFPFSYLGRQSPRAIEREYRIQTVHWSFSSLDSRLDPDRIVARVKRYLYPGSIILMHDGVGKHSKFTTNREATVAALPRILEACRENGLTPVPLSDLLPTDRKK
ncbi:MAG: polysaccharide deacetylase family protein [Proteobacteria bacterium]|nr:polysaccharide deacetylase family protein [Pseudomonadota bacterium]